MDLTEAEEIKKRWQGYTELYKKGLNELDNHNGVISHLGQTSWVVKIFFVQFCVSLPPLLNILCFC